MFAIDDQGTFAEQDKLGFISHALQAERSTEESVEREILEVAEAPSMYFQGASERPFIRVSRGNDFADAFSPDYFAKTFPSCFPYGDGGPLVAGRDGV